jgi:hypothetical protein
MPILLIILAGCANPPVPLDTAPDFVGFITQEIPGENDDQPDQIVVESHADRVASCHWAHD